MKTARRVPICILAMVASTLALPGSDSTPVLFRGDAQHTGTCPDSKIPAGEVKWSFQTGNNIRSTPALYKGVGYFGSDDGHLYALDIQTGKLQWKFQAAGAVSSSPAVYHGTVYIEAGDAAFHAVDANIGREKWTVKTDAPIPPDPKLMSNGKWEFEHASPVIAGDAVYFGGADGYLYALDPATGKQMWRFKTAGRIRATPAIADGVVYVGSMDGHLYAVDAQTGTEKWKFKTAGNKYFPLGEVQSSPAVGDGMVYFGSRDGALYAIDTAKGALRWKADQENFSWVISGPALYKGMVIVGTSDAQNIKAYDAKTGQLKWKAASPEPANIFALPTICGDTLYIGDFYGSMVWLSAFTGNRRMIALFVSMTSVIPAPGLRATRT